MGSIFQPKCNCHHPFNEILMGGGMMDMGEKCFVPYYCDNCGVISGGNLFMKSHRCRKCKKEMKMFGEVITSVNENINDLMSDKYVFTWEFDLNKIYRLENKLYKCPNCKNQHLSIIECGMWD